MSTHPLEVRLPARPLAPRRQIHALTGLRFFAALHVVVYHLWLHFRGDFAAFPAWTANLATCGYLGVPLFFLLSGFVMAITYLDRPPGEEASIDARRYWIARLARIYPVYLLSLVLALPFFLKYTLPSFPADLAGPKALAGLILHGVLMQSWNPPLILELNPPAWSLSVEAFFYAVFPWLVTSQHLTRLDRGGLFRAGALFWGASVALSGVVVMILAANPHLDAQQIDGFRCVFPLLRLPDFLLGLVVGRLYLLRREDGGHTKAPGTLGVAIALIGTMALLGEQVNHGLVSSLMLLPFAALLLGLAQPGCLLGRWLSRPGMVLLGEASYALYILHMPLLYAMQYGLGKFPGLPILTNPLVYHPAFLALVIGLSVLVFRRLEAPMREQIKRALA